MTAFAADHPLAAPTPDLDEIVKRASLRIRAIQFPRTLPMLLVSLLAVWFAFHTRVDTPLLDTWVALLGSASIGRALLCRYIAKNIDSAPAAKLSSYESGLYVSAIVNGFAVGSSFWLVAANSELTVKLVMTLLSCFYAIGALVNAATHFRSFALVSSINLGQGVLFWLGVDNTMQIEVALPYCAVAGLIISFGYEISTQFRESYRVRTELKSAMNELEKKNVLVQQALEQARLASESKSRFLAAASHDLRQPLHAMTMFLGTLSFHVPQGEGHRVLGRVKDTAQLLEEQFNSLLDLSRFDSGAIPVEPSDFDLKDLLTRLLDGYQSHAKEKGLQLVEHVESVWVRTDRLMLERVMRNLIGNAIKYTDRGSITISTQCREQDVWLSISDTGPGIPEDQQTHIFEEYFQLDNPGRQRKLGVGLGLSIVKRINALLDGRLQLVSKMGSGTTFTWRIPLKARDQVDRRESNAEIPAAVRTIQGSVWILEDDLNAREAMTELLQSWGLKVRPFVEPDSLLSEIRSGIQLPTSIITDDMLGTALSGLDVAKLLHAEHQFDRVCILTGNYDPSRMQVLQDSGMTIFLKPVKTESIASWLAE